MSFAEKEQDDLTQQHMLELVLSDWLSVTTLPHPKYRLLTNVRPLSKSTTTGRNTTNKTGQSSSNYYCPSSRAAFDGHPDMQSGRPTANEEATPSTQYALKVEAFGSGAVIVLRKVL